MKEAIVQPNGTVSIRDAPIPKPGSHEVLVKVVVAGTNPKDWMFPERVAGSHNSGDDVAGIVESIGSDVCEFRKGDRVAGMHKFPLPHGAFAEYAVLSDYMTFHIPDKTGFEEAATLPLAILTAAFGLYYVLNLPAPWHRTPSDKIPLVIYSVSTAVGAFAVQLASAAGIHPIVAIGSSNSAFVEQYLDSSKGDVLIDYKAHRTPEALREVVRSALTKADVSEGRPFHALDLVSHPDTFETLSKMMAGPPKDGCKPKIATVLPGLDYSNVDSTVEVEQAYCGLGHEGDEHAIRFAAVLFKMLTQGLNYGWLQGHPYGVQPGGLDGIEATLKASKEGKIRAKKLVVRIGESSALQ